MCTIPSFIMKRGAELRNALDLYSARGLGVLFTTLILLLACGCMAEKSAYPGHWPRQVQQISIRNLSGQYHSSLLEVLKFSSGIKIDNSACIYDFIINEQEISFRPKCISEGDSISTEFIPVNAQNFDMKIKAKEAGLEIIYKPKHVADNPVAGYQKEYLLLSMAVDGSLIVEKGGEAYGMAFLIFPVAVGTNTWYRFYDGKLEIQGE